MGKKRIRGKRKRRKKKRKRPPQNELANLQFGTEGKRGPQDKEDVDEDSIFSKDTCINRMLAQLNSPEESVRYRAILTISSQVFTGRQWRMEELMQSKSMKRLLHTLCDDCHEIRLVGAGILKNLTICGGQQVCEGLIERDVTSMLFSSVDSVYQEWFRLSSSIQTTDMSSSSAAVERLKKTYEIDLKILVELIYLISFLCEQSVEATTFVTNNDKVISTLINLLKNVKPISKLHNEVLHAVGQCMNVITDENESFARKLSKNAQFVPFLLQFVRTPGKESKKITYSTFFCTCVCGILFNFVLSCCSFGNEKQAMMKVKEITKVTTNHLLTTIGEGDINLECVRFVEPLLLDSPNENAKRTKEKNPRGLGGSDDEEELDLLNDEREELEEEEPEIGLDESLLDFEDLRLEKEEDFVEEKEKGKQKKDMVIQCWTDRVKSQKMSLEILANIVLCLSDQDLAQYLRQKPIFQTLQTQFRKLLPRDGKGKVGRKRSMIDEVLLRNCGCLSNLISRCPVTVLKQFRVGQLWNVFFKLCVYFMGRIQTFGSQRRDRRTIEKEMAILVEGMELFTGLVVLMIQQGLDGGVEEKKAPFLLQFFSKLLFNKKSPTIRANSVNILLYIVMRKGSKQHKQKVLGFFMKLMSTDEDLVTVMETINSSLTLLAADSGALVNKSILNQLVLVHKKYAQKLSLENETMSDGDEDEIIKENLTNLKNFVEYCQKRMGGSK